MGESNNSLGKDHLSNRVQAPVLQDDNIKRLSAAGSIDVSEAFLITFDSDAEGAKLNLGSSADASDYFVLSGGDSFFIGKDVDDIYVDTICGYILS